MAGADDALAGPAAHLSLLLAARYLEPLATLLELFPTPLLECRWPDTGVLNEALSEAILRRVSATGITISNVGGWHSKKDLQEWREPCAQEFAERIRQMARLMTEKLYPRAPAECLDGWQLEAWANVNPPGAFNKAHDHSGNQNIWSGVYYVQSGQTQMGARAETLGHTRFENRSLVPLPHLAEYNLRGIEHAIRPEGGLMVLFPASLRHYVEPHRGETVRITIAFNLRHPLFTVPRYKDMEEPSWLWRNFRGPMTAYSWLVRLLSFRSGP